MCYFLQVLGPCWDRRSTFRPSQHATGEHSISQVVINEWKFCIHNRTCMHYSTKLFQWCVMVLCNECCTFSKCAKVTCQWSSERFNNLNGHNFSIVCVCGSFVLYVRYNRRWHIRPVGYLLEALYPPMCVVHVRRCLYLCSNWWSKACRTRKWKSWATVLGRYSTHSVNLERCT